MMYVAYSYPNVGSEQGFIYLPDKGRFGNSTSARFSGAGKMESGTMLPAWEALIKPVIANAEAAPGSTSASGAGAPQSQKPSKTSELATDGWTKPQPGWLYVLDPQSSWTIRATSLWLVIRRRATSELSENRAARSTAFGDDFTKGVARHRFRTMSS